MKRLALVVMGAVLAACGDGEGDTTPLAPLDVPDGCQALAHQADCLLPFPSDAFLSSDASTPSGKRVEINGAAQPLDAKGASVDFTSHVTADGFSPGSQILALFPEGVDDSDLIFHTDDVTKSLDKDSFTQILEAETGEPVLHFAEVDPRAEEGAARALVLRPLVRLHDGKRYVVVLRRLKRPDGAAVTPPEGFRRLRDRQGTGDPKLAPLAERFEKDVFPVIAKRGLTRRELTLAWDFTVRSKDNLVGDMLEVRAQTLAYLAQPPKLEIVAVTDAASEHIARRIDARVTVPLFLDKNEPLSSLTRDSEGHVIQNGTTQAEFSVFVPPSVANRAQGMPPARLLQYGHGFFGSLEEAAGFPSQLADEKGFVVVATNWVGMSEQDRFRVVEQLVTKMGDGMRFVDRAHQAMANAIVVGAVAQGELAQRAELQFGAGAAYDPATLYFYGNSMGHILGGTYLALSPDVERGVLGVGGANLSFIMFRARPLAAFLLFVGQVFPDAIDQQKFAALGQLGFDRLDPLSYAPNVLQDTFEGSPATRRVLMQVGIGDSEVNPLAAELHARALGLGTVKTPARAIAGVPEQSTPVDGSALVEFDFKVDPLPGLLAIPPTDSTDVHEGVRRLTASKQQLDGFLRSDGKIEHTCSGVCDPE
ncbi:MAG: hypothetical protein R3B13_18355 [Polyangiaceae bacterium]